MIAGVHKIRGYHIEVKHLTARESGGFVVIEVMKNMENVTYIVKCRDGSLYTGWTNNIDRRIRMHNEGKGAKYTRARRPVELVYLEAFDSKEKAMSREARIKQLTKKEKLLLIEEYQQKQNLK